jgi:hypothetical protein
MVNTTYRIPTPCWHYYKTESSDNDLVFTSKVYGKYEGDPCVQIVSSLPREEQITFQTLGEKILRFWQNDSIYLDTAILLH